MTEILDASYPLAGFLSDWIPTAAALLTRLSLLVLMLPGIGDAVIPVRIRLALAIALVGILLPLAPVGPETVSVPLLLGEAFAGFTLGFGARVFIFVLSMTGTIIAQALSLSQVFGLATQGDSSSLLSSALVLAGSALFLTADFEVVLVRQLVDNLDAVPPGFVVSMDPGAVASTMTRLAADAVELAVTLGIPFLVLNFSYYLVLGFLNRAMPQLMITFVGLPAITLSGLVLFMLGVAALLSVWLTRVSGALAP